jgi:hypothetical protein
LNVDLTEFQTNLVSLSLLIFFFFSVWFEKDCWWIE